MAREELCRRLWLELPSWRSRAAMRGVTIDDDDEVFIEDLGSRNGTFVEEQRVTGPVRSMRGIVSG